MGEALSSSAEVEQHQEAKGDEAAQDDAVPPPLRPDPRDESVDAGDLCGRRGDASIDARQRLPLDAKVLIDGVGLGQDAVDHVVALVEAPALLEHVFRLRLGRVRAAEGIDVGTDVGEEMLPIAGLGDGRL